MKYCILMGSPRKSGNTKQLLDPIIEKLTSHGADYQCIWLYDKKIEYCIACRRCQQDWSSFGCWQQDDLQEIFDEVLSSDVIILATPIYSWYCTPPMKALLDRLVYGMNKYYGDKKGPSLWESKRVALVTTCGYPPEKGADLWEKGIIRYCKHSKLEYLGTLTEHDLGYSSVFMDELKEKRAGDFGDMLISL